MTKYTATATDAQLLQRATDARTLILSVGIGLLTLEALEALTTLSQPALRAAIDALAVQLDARAATRNTPMQQGEAQGLMQALDAALQDGTL